MAVAIITGASRGLGRGLARALAERGWALVLDARGAEDLEAVVDELATRTQVVGLPGDIADAAHRRELVSRATELGPLALLVGNAGALGPSPLPRLADYPLAAFEDVHRVNVTAALGLVQEALPALRAAGGTIVQVTSDAAVEGYEGWGGYGSSKAALEQLANVLAAEEPELHVHRFDPGDMRTRMHQDAFPGEDISDRPAPEERAVPALVRLIEGDHPSGRWTAADLLEGAVR
jgi:NAD(P)-dependent dehydrogenase (short-subunit alcohol dehydrogenase family)